jgi:predicted DNA-binding helix-hairpin-helix protein
MDMLVSTAEILRKHFRYRGYIHLKIIPGASRASIESALSYASAVSLNIETPGAKHFSRLTTMKEYQKDIIDPLTFIAEQTRREGRFSRVSTSSQFIVGASDESDQEILSYGSRMYSNLKVGRLYFSAYQGGLGDPSIPGEQNREVQTEQLMLFDLGPQKGTSADALMREHRLYQADWLLRKYGFSYDDLVFGKSGNLNLHKDPKLVWAESHPDKFPVSVKRASKEQLLRVPGIGPSYAERIVGGRGSCALSALEDLRLPPATLRKARTFLEM